MKRDDNPIRSKSALREGRFYIGKAIAFANQEHSASVEDAASLIFDDIGISYTDVGKPDPKLLAIIRKERRRVGHVLADIIEDPAITANLERNLNFWLGETRATLLQFVDGEMTLRFRLNTAHPALMIVEAAHIGIAFLFPLNLARFLRRCDEGCGKLFMAEGKRSRAKYCSECVAEIKRDQNKAYVASHRKRRKWLEENDPSALMDVDSGRITLAAAYESSQSKQRRK